MLKIEFHFPKVKPPSVNDSKAIKKGRMIKTQKHKSFTGLVKRLMSIRSRRIKEFEDSYNGKENCLSCRIVVEIPERDYFTQQREIPKKKNDVDNFVKTLLDAVFLSFGKLDDAFIVSLFVIKVVSKDNFYHSTVKLQIENLDEIT